MITAQRPFAKVAGLRDALRSAVDQSSKGQQLILIQAHPDLGGKLAKAGNLSPDSMNEQAGVGLDKLTNAQFEKITNLNSRYQEKFGFPFVICARKTSQTEILNAFENRMHNPVDAEFLMALSQIHEIAELRLLDLVKA